MKLLTISEVCDALRISRSKLYGLWEKGEGPEFLHIGSQRRVRADVLDAWINDQANVT